MQQIADWLEKLGLSEYTQRFVENDIDVSVLPHLTDQDLKELGVSLGHRRKMLSAIAEPAGRAVPMPPQSALTASKPSPALCSTISATGISSTQCATPNSPATDLGNSGSNGNSAPEAANLPHSDVG
jgi:hypothetical protein